jgi:hypothetical protein
MVRAFQLLRRKILQGCCRSFSKVDQQIGVVANEGLVGVHVGFRSAADFREAILKEKNEA